MPKAPKSIPGFATDVEFLPTGSITPYVNNSRAHSEDQVAQVIRSIELYGFNNPILLDSDRVVVAGHARLMAAIKLNMAQVPCIVLGHLTPQQRRAYLIADNKIALNSTWDEAALKAELEDLLEGGVDIKDLGWDSMPEFMDEMDPDLVEELDEEGDGDPTDVRRAIQIEFDPEDYQKAYEACGAIRKAGMNLGRVVLPAILEAQKLT